MKDHQNFDEGPGIESEDSMEIDASAFQDQVANDTKTIFVYTDEIAPRSIKTILKALLSKVIQDLGITPDDWRNLVEHAINSIPGGEALPNDKKVQIRASINKNFNRLPDMTWKKLVEGLRLLRILRFRISLTLVHPDETVTEHALWVKLRNKDESDHNAKKPIRVATVRHNDTEQQPNAWAGRPAYQPQHGKTNLDDLSRRFGLGPQADDESH